MRGILMRSGIAIILSVLTICLFFNAKKMGNYFYNASAAITEAQTSFQEIDSTLELLDRATLDFSQTEGVIKGATQGMKEATVEFLKGAGKFLANLSDRPAGGSQQSEAPPVEEDERFEQKKAEMENDLKERTLDTARQITALQAKIRGRQQALKGIKEEVPSAMRQWIMFFLSLFGTVVAWYEVFFPVQIVNPGP